MGAFSSADKDNDDADNDDHHDDDDHHCYDEHHVFIFQFATPPIVMSWRRREKTRLGVVLPIKIFKYRNF